MDRYRYFSLSPISEIPYIRGLGGRVVFLPCLLAKEAAWARFAGASSFSDERLRVEIKVQSRSQKEFSDRNIRRGSWKVLFANE